MLKRKLRVMTYNTHCGLGPSDVPGFWRKLLARIGESRVYPKRISGWLARLSKKVDIVGLQEVRHNLSPFSDPQFEIYRKAGFKNALRHIVGTWGFRYDNVLLSNLARVHLPDTAVYHDLPGKVYGLATCGFTLAPYEFCGKQIWVGNVHLHPYDPHLRSVQVRYILERIQNMRDKYGDVPIIILGDFNAVLPGLPVGPFKSGDPDPGSYVGDESFKLFFVFFFRVPHHEDQMSDYTYPTMFKDDACNHKPNRTLDFILCTEGDWEICSYAVLQDVDHSDHYPVLGEFILK